jgi:hypothetical protein
VGSHWWAERPDGSWVRWSWLHADWEDHLGPPEGVEPLRADSPPRLRPPPVPPSVDELVHDATLHWVFGFAVWTGLGVIALLVLKVILDFALSLWGDNDGLPILPAILWLTGIAAVSCAICVWVDARIIRAAARRESERIAAGLPPPERALERPLRGAGLVLALIGAGVVVCGMLAIVWWGT